MSKLPKSPRLAPPYGNSIDRDKPIDFEFDGKKIKGFKGDTIASALIANGQWLMSRSFKYHRPRAPLTMAGQDANTLVQLQDAPNSLGDVVQITPGLLVASQNTTGSLERDWMSSLGLLSKFLPVGFYYKAFYRPRGIWEWWAKFFRPRAGLGVINVDAVEVEREKQYCFCDVVVVGGGATGMQAAIAAGEAGADVILIEESHSLGGSLLYQRSSDSAQVEHETLAKLQQAIAQQKNIKVMLNAVVNSWHTEHWLAVSTEQRLYKLRAKQTILATGVLEQPAVFRGNDIPGVVMGSAVQRLLKKYAVKPAERAVILAGNDEAYGVALDLVEAGVAVSAVIDLRVKPFKSQRFQAVADLGLCIKTGHAVYQARCKQNHLSSVQVRAIESSGQCGTQGFNIDCDLLVMSVGFMPTYQLACQAGAQLDYDDDHASFHLRNLPSGMHLVGAVAGQWPLRASLRHASDLAKAVANDALGFDYSYPLTSSMEHHGLNHPWPIFPHPKGKEFVDFDEDLTINDIINATKDGYEHIQLVKRYSTCGMGPSQGRQSALAAARLVAKATNKTVAQTGVTTARPPFTQEPLGVNAGRSFFPHRHTPMHHHHLAAGATMMQAGTWYRPAYYGSDDQRQRCIQAEAQNVREAVGLIDVSTLGGLDIRGQDAAEFLNRLYTSRFEKVAVGRSKYAVLCNEAGVVIDDGVACRLAQDHFYITATTGGVDRVFQTMLRWNVQWQLDIDISNVTSAYCAVNLAGPKAKKVLSTLCSADLSQEAFPYMGVQKFDVAGIPARVMRVGFVGELGYEIHVPNLFGKALWEALMHAGADQGIRPFGVEAQRLLRLEKGHVIIGQDTDAMTTPAELQMRWAVANSKDDFIGKRSLSELDKLSPQRKLAGFVFDAINGLPEEAHLVVDGNAMTGRVTSAAVSPSCNQGVGLAYVQAHLNVGDQIQIKIQQGKQITATLVELPFYDPQQARQEVEYE